MFHEIFYRPLFNALVFIYNIPGADFGLAIIAMTIIIRLALFPLSIKGARSQKAMADIAPDMAKLKEKYKNDQQAYSAAVLALYKERGVNPITGCLPLLIQLPIIFALYRVFFVGINESNLGDLYSFVARPDNFSTMFLGVLDMVHKYWFFAPLLGILQFIQSKMSLPAMTADSPSSAINKQMLYIFPFVLAIISWSLPAGVNLYLATTTAFSVFEQWYIRRK